MNAVDPNPIGQADGALCSRDADGRGVDDCGLTKPVTWAIPEEVAIAVQINSSPFTVMMATPANLADFGAGIALSEGIVADISAIHGVLVMPVEGGYTVDIAIDQKDIIASRLTGRSIEGRTGCGLCGVEDIADVVRVSGRVTRTTAPDPAAILKAASALPDHQPMNRHNRTVHGAAWVLASGDIALVREDVGRHNALDKLIGALSKAKNDLSSGFVLMTSRCSFELVQKCALSGIGALVTVSAPTTLALDLSRRSNVFLASLATDRVVIFNA